MKPNSEKPPFDGPELPRELTDTVNQLLGKLKNFRLEQIPEFIRNQVDAIRTYCRKPLVTMILCGSCRCI